MPRINWHPSASAIAWAALANICCWLVAAAFYMILQGAR
jgi:hypothetical protein